MKRESLIGAEEVARRLSISRHTVLKMVQGKKIPHIRISHCCVRFDPRKITEWIEARSFKPIKKPLKLLRGGRNRA